MNTTRWRSMELRSSQSVQPKPAFGPVVLCAVTVSKDVSVTFLVL